MRYQRFHVVIVFLLLAAVLLGACGGPAPAPSPTPAPAEASQPAQPTLPVQAAPTQAAPAGDSLLVGKVWQWNKTIFSDGRTVEVASPASYTVEFMADGKVSVKADCNMAAGGYTVDGANLAIQLGPMTMAMCPPESLSDEFVKELGEVAQYQVSGETLHLVFKLDSGSMSLTSGAAAQPVQAPGQDLSGTWHWQSTAYSDGKLYTPANAADYTIAFSLTDGKVAIKADCNNAMGDFMTDGQNLEIMIGGVTRAMCSPESLSAEYLKQLSEVGSYKVEGATLYLFLKLDSGTMTLTSGGAAAQPAEPTQPAAPAVELGGTAWQWVKTIYNNDTTVTAPDPAKYQLTFDMQNNHFLFTADCNNGSGVFTLDGQNLALTVQGMTLALCPPPADDFVKQLGEVASYKIEGNTLYLMLKYDSGTMTFTTGGAPAASAPAATPVPAAGGPSAVTGPDAQRLTSGVWKWAKSVDNSGKDWTPANPANYTVQFTADGKVAIKADCNNAAGSYTTAGGSLEILIGPMTMAACPPPSLGDVFVVQLGQAGSYFFDGNSLIIEWKMDSGSMRFEP